MARRPPGRSAEIAHAWFALVGAREQLALARTVAAHRERTLALAAALSAQRQHLVAVFRGMGAGA